MLEMYEYLVNKIRKKKKAKQRAGFGYVFYCFYLFVFLLIGGPTCYNLF